LGISDSPQISTGHDDVTGLFGGLANAVGGVHGKTAGLGKLRTTTLPQQGRKENKNDNAKVSKVDE